MLQFEGLLASHFDAKYTLSSEETHLHGNYYFFDGYTGTKIYRDAGLGKWKMVGLGEKSQNATCEANDCPLGTHVWKLNRGEADKNGGNMTLNLNGCYDEWQFNCYDGSCIDITARWVQTTIIQGANLSKHIMLQLCKIEFNFHCHLGN